MDFSPQQAKAVTEVGAFLNDPTRRVYRLDGYAGTGKTTLARHLASQHDGETLFGAFTGKAASVLTKKGCPASTLHSLLYVPKTGDKEVIQAKQKELAKNPEGPGAAALREELKELNTLKFVHNEESPLFNTDVLFVDEVSMVGEELGNDLLRFPDLKIVVLGDPGQLPPISGEGFFQTKYPCDFVLTEIHRQAAGNPIITLATMVRQGHGIKPGRFGDSIVQRRNGTTAEQLVGADQVIVGTNASRGKFNRLIRDHFNFTSLACPEKGEKVICLQNNKELGILNGTQWFVDTSSDKGIFVELGLLPWDDRDAPGAKPLALSAHPFDADLKSMMWYEKKQAEQFDFGYAITCHKSQGSQWDRVFIQDESWCFKENSKNWLYTAITRAAETVVIAI